jgi:hypothetical protein
LLRADGFVGGLRFMGGFSVIATVDEFSETVYVSNDTDGTVSLFPSHH